MDSSDLVRRSFRLLLLAIFAVVVFAAWTFVRGRVAERRSLHGHVDGVDNGGGETVKRYIRPSGNELRSYLRIIHESLNAYSNSQVEAMFENMRLLPLKAYQLRGEEHLELERPINRIWREDWVLKKGAKEFALAEEFGRQLKNSLAIAKLYGEFMVASGTVANKILVTIDWIALKRLQTYRDQFEREGRTDCLNVAEQLLADWIRQIESENGFTRAYMRSQAVGLRRFVETGELPVEKLVPYVRDSIRPIQEHCGYTPTWLDKEFPLSPKDRDKVYHHADILEELWQKER